MESKNYLRDLAKQVRDISQESGWLEKEKLWKQKNALKKVRPLILCTLPDEAWREIISEESLISEDPFLKKYEWYLKRQIYRAKHLRDDEIIGNTLYVPLRYQFSDWAENRKRPYSKDGKHAEKFYPVIHEYRDIDRLKMPELMYVDEKGTERDAQRLKEILGDILNVETGEPYSADTDSYVKGWGHSLIDILCELRGLENIFLDLVLAPDFVHEAMDFLMRGVEGYMRAMKENHLLRLNNNAFVMRSNTPLGSNGLALSDELPGKDYDPQNIDFKNLWGYCMAQEFSEVSPEMHAEFVLPYQKRLGERFGMLSYGCCEPNDRKWDNIFKTFGNLREGSISHCADIRIAAEQIADRYVFSWKPDCTVLANFDGEVVREQLKNGFDTAKDCHVVCCLRDNITLFGHSENAEKWTDIAMALALEYQ